MSAKPDSAVGVTVKENDTKNVDPPDKVDKKKKTTFVPANRNKSKDSDKPVQAQKDTAYRQPKSTSFSPEASQALDKAFASLPGADTGSNPKEIIGIIAFDRYAQAVAQAYLTIVERETRLTTVFSLPEYYLFHIGLLVWRIQWVRFKYNGDQQIRSLRWPIPDDLPIHGIIWKFLASIGITKDPVLGRIYIPDMIYPSTKHRERESDKYAFDFKTAIAEMRAGRKARRAEEGDQHLYDSRYNRSRFMTGEKHGITRKVTKLNYDSEENSDTPDFENPTGKEELKTGKVKIFIQKVKANSNSMEEEVSSVVHKVLNENKYLYPDQIPHRGGPKPEDDPGFYEPYPREVQGKDLGYDEQLLTDYRSFVARTERTVIYSLSAPKPTEGDYGWVLQIIPESDHFVAKGPRTGIEPNAGPVALICQFGKFSTTMVETVGWHNSVHHVPQPKTLLMALLHANFIEVQHR
jgi:hypothetical protein